MVREGAGCFAGFSQGCHRGGGAGQPCGSLLFPPLTGRSSRFTRVASAGLSCLALTIFQRPRGADDNAVIFNTAVDGTTDGDGTTGTIANVAVSAAVVGVADADPRRE